MAIRLNDTIVAAHDKEKAAAPDRDPGPLVAACVCDGAGGRYLAGLYGCQGIWEC